MVFAIDVFLILFLAVLFGVFLSRTSAWLADHLPVSYLWCLGAVTTLLVLLTLGGLTVFGMQIKGQLAEASEHIDEAQQRIQEAANRYPLVKSTISATPILRELVQLAPPKGGENVSPESSEVDDESDDRELSNNSSQSPESSDGSEPPQQLTQKTLRTAQQGVAVLAGLFQTTFGVVGNSMLIFFFGLFVAIGPQQYRDGIVVLFPLQRRERTREVMNMLGDTLWRWLIGRFGSMLVTGIGTGVLLAVLGVPMALTIGVVTALLTFIPNIGAIISLTLAVLLALPQNGSTVIMVIVGYIALQLIESYIVTPLIEQQQVSLPPALLIAFQVVMGVLFGFLGAAVASPLLAVTKVCVEQVYIKDVLESEASF
ncbi:MAG TPA: AI-2E family transporter [Pirellulaceae bacterium]|nr:AI-2E family transporter [Pirellulaceae bacterium]